MVHFNEIPGGNNGFNNNNGFQLSPMPKLSLEKLWDIYNSNKEGNSAEVIDSEEVAAQKGSYYFLEEGMTKKEFIEKNSSIFLYSDALVSELMGEYSMWGMSTDLWKERERAVGMVVKDMIANGEFEKKKEVILDKFTCIDEETQLLVLEQLTPEEQENAISRLSDKKQALIRTKLDTIKQPNDKNPDNTNEPEPSGFAE